MIEVSSAAASPLAKFADVERTGDEVVLDIGRSKTDQEGQGDQIAVPNGRKLKPIEALDAWLKAAAIPQGPIFRRVMKGGRRRENFASIVA